MNIKELFEKIENGEDVPEWISIEGKHPKFGTYNIDGENFHFRKEDRTYYIVGEKHSLQTLESKLVWYQKNVYEQFLIKESTATEQEKMERLKGDRTLSISEEIGLEIIR